MVNFVRACFKFYVRETEQFRMVLSPREVMSVELTVLEN
jgi:hypothetical protein